MRKSLLFIVCCIAVSFTMAQDTIPNAGFEFWNGNTPDNWTTINSVSSGNCQRSTSFHGGAASVHLTTSMSILTPPYNILPGMTASKGVVNPFNPSVVEGGFPYAQRADTLIGWYRYTPVGVDTLTIEVLLLKRNGTARDTIGRGRFRSSMPQAVFTEFRIRIDSLSASMPDTALIIMLSSPITSPSLGTQLWVDDLALHVTDVGINDIAAARNDLNVYPNPSSSYLNISAPRSLSGAMLEIYNLLGEKVIVQTLTDASARIDIASLPDGMYTYRLTESSGMKVSAGTFSRTGN